MEEVNLFSEKFHEVIGKSIHSVLLENWDKDDLGASVEDWVSKNQHNLSCSYCRIQFKDLQAHREHYKLDWHRYNLKQSLQSKVPISEEDFNEKTGNDDLSSISGSDSEKEDTLDTYAIANGKIFLQNHLGQVFSLYRCLMFDRKEEITDSDLHYRLKRCVDNKQWTILMLGGGHFAGVIFNGGDPVLHKTFHCYTVRSGQGGSQSSRDSKSGGSQPKSAGSSLRRYNEQALVQHVKGIVENWKTEIENSSLIIYRASGPYNRGVLFGGKTPLVDRSDKRLRTIPFATRRATFSEVKRVHYLLTTTEVYSSLHDASDRFSKQKSPEAQGKRNKIRASYINRAKSRENKERPLPTLLSRASSCEQVINKLDINEKLEGIDLSTNDVEISFDDLEEFGYRVTLEQRKKIHKKKKPKKSKTKKLNEQEEARKKELFNVLCKGDLEKLKKLLENHLKSSENSENKTDKNSFVNEVIDENLNTLLHIAALNEHNELVSFLLENDSNPCLKNKNQQTAYTCTQNKEIRETLKQFAKENPERYNYNKAQIPVNALTKDEVAEKKKVQRKIKKEKEKEQKKENKIKRIEDEEKNRFLQLSDREKRALAAERRILSQSGTVIIRCFLCALDIAGKVPFEYMGNRFCSIECLKAHRMQNPLVLL